MFVIKNQKMNITFRITYLFFLFSIIEFSIYAQSQNSLNILKKVEFKWEKSGGILPYINESSAAYSYNSVYIKGDSAIFTCDFNYEILIASIKTGKTIKKIKLNDYPNDLIFDKDNNLFYVLSIRDVFVFDAKFNLLRTLNFKTLNGDTKLALVNSSLFAVGPEESIFVAYKGVKANELKAKGQPFHNQFIKPTLTGYNSFKLEHYSTSNFLIKQDNYTINSNYEIATINPVGVLNGNTIMLIEFLISDSPISIISKLAEVKEGEVLNLIDLPNIYYTKCFNEFNQQENEIYHTISTPEGVFIYSLKYETSKYNTYPSKLLNMNYHYNDYLKPEYDEGTNY